MINILNQRLDHHDLVNTRQRHLQQNMSVQIIPSIFVKSKSEFLSQITAVEGSVDMVQIDIGDGKFVSDTTWYNPEITRDNLKMDAELHLMVSDPLAVAKEWLNVPQLKRILIHYESVSDIQTTIKQLQQYNNWKISLALNPETSAQIIEPYINDIQGVMFMGIHPGFQGQTLIPEILLRIRDFKNQHPDTFVEIDGGVNEETLPKIVASGVDAICPGSAVFRNERTPIQNISRLKKIVEELTNQ